MKKIVLTTALCLSMAGAATAENGPATKIRPDQLHKDMVVSSQSAELTTTSSGASLLIPLLLILIIAAAAGSGGGSHHYYPYPPSY